MFTNALSNPLYCELIHSNPDIRQLIEYIENENTLTMRKMTHEINNALTLINSSLQIIESSHPEVNKFKYWNSTMDDIHYLITFMSEISLFNNVGYSLSPSPTDLPEMLNSIISSFAGLNKNINLSISNPDNIPIILSDKTKLRQVFINIIKNSFEALEETSSPYIHISLQYDNTAEKILIMIEDNGCGISPECIETIFSPLVSYKKGGTGLGLSISKKIVEAHNGSLSVTSVPEHGTTFMIELPV